MEDAAPLERNISDAAADFDLMDELLSGECWLETPDCSDLLQQSTSASTSPFCSSGFLSVFEAGNQDDAERPASAFSVSPPPPPPGQTIIVGLGQPEHPARSSGFESANPNWWMQPGGASLSVNDRLIRALNHMKESQRDGDVLIQIWVPVRRGDQQLLTTYGQPFSLDPSCQSLVNYRTVSTRFQFSAERDSSEVPGLPGRVFLGRVPEWTPDVRYFSSFEYPRVSHAQRYNVRGSIALPIFERDTRSCIGVVEVVQTTQKINYSSDLENICSALQAVDLSSCEGLSVPRINVSDGSYQVALPEIQEVLRVVCQTHNLPLAQTWISCIQQGKGGSRHSIENYKDCFSTVDAACYVNDPSMLGFHVACSEHHLLRGQGVAGKAFTTNQPCFSPDITSFIKTEYPLSHHAKLFHLQAAVAIRLRSIHTGNADFVLEFFMPVNCRGSEEQKQMLNSLSITIQQVCQSLRVVTIKELEDEATLEAKELCLSDVSEKPLFEGVQRPDDDNDFSVESPSAGVSGEVPSWVARIMEAQQQGASSAFPSSIPLEFNKQEIEEFSAVTNWDQSEVVVPAGKIFSDFQQHNQDSLKDLASHKGSFSSDPSFPSAGKATEKRRTKTEKTVTLEVLRQYFAGSLKDAARSIGVCPTTLKRICRHHGITRWPSRKIKKVGHSLKKLQVVIDSVQGAEGTFHFSSLYENFSKASGSEKEVPAGNTLSSQKQTDYPESSSAHHQQEERLSSHTSASNSLSSSSCSQNSSSSLGTSSGSKQCTHAPQLVIKQESSMEGNRTGILKRSHSEVELQLMTQEEPLRPLARSQSHMILTELPSSGKLQENKSNLLKIKAMYGEEKVRFRLQPSWGFQDLKLETVKRFNISDANSVDLKYLDDDSEWVLLTCDADLQECIDVYKSSGAGTVRISVHCVSPPTTRAPLGRTGLS